MAFNNLLNKYKSLLLRCDTYSTVLLFLLCGYLLFTNLGELALIAPDEGRNAEVAREMAINHEWLVPTYNGLVYLDKPAFYFKTVALSFSWFGESETVARLSSAGFAFLLLIEVFWFCRKVYDHSTAILATLAVATTSLFWAFARIVIFDMTLAFFVCTTIFSCYLAEEQGKEYRKRWYLLAAAASALATLVKGPVGFILPTLVITLFNLLEGRVKVMEQAFSPRNCLVFMLIVLPWFIGLSWQCPDFPYYGIMKESVARFTTTEFHRTAPFYYYVLIIAATFFPWSLLIPESIYLTWHNRTQLSRPDRLFIIWAIVVVVFFSLSKSKLPGYILTVSVAFGILCARVFAKTLTDLNSDACRIIRHSTLILLIVCLLISLLLTSVSAAPHFLTGLLKPNKIQQIQFVLPYLQPLSLSFLFTAGLCAASYWKKDNRFMFAAFMSVPLLLMTMNFDLLAKYAETHSSRGLAKKVLKELPADAELACIECLPNGLPFYTKRLITVFSINGEEFTSNYIKFTLSSGKAWPEGIVPTAKLVDWLETRKQPVYLLANSRNLASLENIAKRYGVAVSALDSDYWAIFLPRPKA